MVEWEDAEEVDRRREETARRERPLSRREYVSRVVITLIVVALAYAVWRLTSLLLLVFAAMLFAMFLRSIADPLTRLTRLPPGGSLAATVVLLTLAGGGFIMTFGAGVSAQLHALFADLPGAWLSFSAKLEAFGLPRSGLEWIGRQLQLAGGLSTLAQWAGEIAGLAGGLVLASVGGVYIAAQPALYRRGLLSIVPRAVRPQVEGALDPLAVGLRHWLVGQLATMSLVGSLTGLGALAIGLPSAVALGLIAALLEFVPYIGPIATAVPALLLAFSISTKATILTLLLLTGVQQLEGYILTPLIQRRAVLLPPAVTLFSLFGMGIMFGALGVLLAAPLTVCILVIVRRIQAPGALDARSPS